MIFSAPYISTNFSFNLVYPKVKMSRFHEPNPMKKIRKAQESQRRRRKAYRAQQD
jgi:hypothetical protein